MNSKSVKITIIKKLTILEALKILNFRAKINRRIYILRSNIKNNIF